MATGEADDGALLGDRFELGEKLGRGGAGVVHRARDRRTGGAVAVLRRETRLLASLSSPRVVRLTDSDEDAGRVSFAMERAASREGRLPTGEALGIAPEEERDRERHAGEQRHVGEVDHHAADRQEIDHGAAR